MNTNTNNIGLPNIEDLQHLANELFSALPNEFPKEISLSPDHNEHPRATKIAETLLSAANLGQVETVFPVSNHDTLLAQSGFGPSPIPNLPKNPLDFPQTPPSMGGFGGSPSVASYGNIAPIGESQHSFSSIPNPNFLEQDLNGIDTSKYGLGSGEVPFAIGTGNNVNMEDPQTGFSDLNLKNKEESSYLPFEYEGSSFEAELKAALDLVNTSF
jgi:cysteine desulfurase / selenocysteine lyase